MPAPAGDVPPLRGPGGSPLTAPVVVACSGGPDSLGLLVLAARDALDPIAVHVDHGLRPGGVAEAAVVEEAAARLGVRARSVAVRVAPGPNLEARARDARYGALEVARVEAGASVILTAHTADDHAETVLLNLLRGSGFSGLAGIPAAHGAVVRPVLGLRRDELRGVTAALGVVPVEDPTNLDEAHRRNWVRHTVLPLLAEGAGRDLVPLLTRQAAVMAEDAALLDALADELLDAAGRTAPEVAVLRAAPPALARRALRRWLGPPWPSMAELARLDAVVAGEHRAAELAGGRRVSRHDGRLTCTG